MKGIEIKKEIASTKVIGLILSWDVVMWFNGMIDWGDLNDKGFYSFLFLNVYLIITLLDIKKEGFGIVVAALKNLYYDSRLTDNTRIERGKELLFEQATVIADLSIKADLDKKAEEKKGTDVVPFVIPMV